MESLAGKSYEELLVLAYDQQGFIDNVKACIDLLQPGDDVVIKFRDETRQGSIETRVRKRNCEIKSEGWQLSVKFNKDCTVRVYDSKFKKVRPLINAQGMMENYLACMDLVPKHGSKLFIYDPSGPENTVRVIKSTISKWNTLHCIERGMCLHPIFKEECHSVTIIDVTTKENKAQIVKQEKYERQKARKKKK